MSTPSHTKKLALFGAGNIANVHIQGMLAHADEVECVAPA